MPARKGIDPGERQSRNRKIDMCDPEIIGHLNSGEKQGIAALDRVRSSWIANPVVSLQQAFDMKREGFPSSCNHMVDRRRRHRAGGEIRKRRRVSDVAVSFHSRDKGRHSDSHGTGENKPPVSAPRRPANVIQSSKQNQKNTVDDGRYRPCPKCRRGISRQAHRYFVTRLLNCRNLKEGPPHELVWRMDDMIE